MNQPAPPDSAEPSRSAPTPQRLMPLNRTSRTVAEWVTLGVAIAVLTGLMGLIIYDWQVNQSRPPAFRVEVTEPARVADGHYYIPFSITNTGGRIARLVQVTAELQTDAGTETGEQQVDFLSGNERKQGSFVFTHNPQEGALRVRVASYQLP